MSKLPGTAQEVPTCWGHIPQPVPTSPAWGATHNWKLSLYLGAQLLFLDLVANFLFLSLRWGPMMLTSMKGRKMPEVCHLRSLAATTAGRGQVRLREHCHLPQPGTLATKPTFDSDFVLATGVGQELHVDGHLPNGVIHARACDRERRWKCLFSQSS